jgi:membrane associated rhomboid family serine protease
VNSAAGSEVDPSVCYRHPDRTSWTLCERCGRTICPECQILTPQGVRCPDCVRETGGSVQWAPAGGSRVTAAQAKRRRATRARVVADRPVWQQALVDVLRPGDTTPIISWSIAAAFVLVWIAGIFTPVLFSSLAMLPGTTWQLWRFVTYAVTSSPGLSALGVLNVLLSVVFLLLSTPAAEREFGRRRFLIVAVASTIAGGAIGGLVFGVAVGLSGLIFGIFGAYLILAWPSPPVRVRLLISIAAYALITLLFAPIFIGQVIGGLVGGAGSYYLLHRNEDSSQGTRRSRIIIVAVLAALVVLVVVKNVITLLAS